MLSYIKGIRPATCTYVVVPGMTLSHSPEAFESCMERHFYRGSTVSLFLGNNYVRYFSLPVSAQVYILPVAFTGKLNLACLL